MCNHPKNRVSLVQRVKFLFSNNLKDLESQGYKISWSRKKMPSKMKLKVKKRDGYVCQYCRVAKSDKKMTIDHYIPYSVFHSHDFNNLKSSCRLCNEMKGSINPEDKKDTFKWNKFLKKAKDKVTQREVRASFHVHDARYIKGKISFETYIRYYLEMKNLYNVGPSEKLNFSRKINNKIRKEQESFWVMNIDGGFYWNDIFNYFEDESLVA